MSLTSKGKAWEAAQSLYILLTLPMGFFSWVAFLYIGYRARQLKWLIAGVIYLIPGLIKLKNILPIRISA